MYENQNGTVRLKVIMADIKPSSEREVFYTYSMWQGSGSYTFPTNWVLDATIGTYIIDTTQYFYVNNQQGDRLLATWTDRTEQDYKVYQSGGVLGVTKVTTEYIPPSGHSIDCVSCQITGDYMVHTYRYRKDSGGTIENRKVRVTNLKTGSVYNFTEQDLAIEDVSPLGSSTQRWKLLTAIGAFNKVKEKK
jgi:hypothetical protein